MEINLWSYAFGGVYSVHLFKPTRIDAFTVIAFRNLAAIENSRLLSVETCHESSTFIYA